MAVGFAPDVSGNMGVGPLCVDCSGPTRGVAPAGWSIVGPTGPGIPPATCTGANLGANVASTCQPLNTYQPVNQPT